MESFDTLFIELGTNMPLLQHNNEKNNINSLTFTKTKCGSAMTQW